jgi:hypothetical protein
MRAVGFEPTLSGSSDLRLLPLDYARAFLAGILIP